MNTEQDPNHSHSGDNGKGVIDKPPIFQEEGEYTPQQCGDQSTYMQRFTINEMPVGTKDGRATFLIGDLQGNETDKKRVTAFQKNKEDFIMREVVHNWHFEVDGKKYFPKQKCNHNMGDGTIELVTSPPSPLNLVL